MRAFEQSLIPTRWGYRAAHFVVNFGIETYSCTINVAIAELP